MELDGQVVRKPFGAGSKSERPAIVLRTPGGDYVLRRQGGLAYGDPDLERLIGKRLRCRGTLSGYTFLMTDCAEIADEP
jgi:hypothetical protein